MDETPSPASSSQDGTRQSTPGNGSLRKSHRHAVEVDDAADPIECTGKSYQSCTAGLIADCVAVCCCPCAVVDILLFTFLKIPYMVGRKWLTKGKKMRKCERSNSEKVVNRDAISSKGRIEEGTLEDLSMEIGDEELKDNFSARFEAEEVWLELYRSGHLGFGRVSFTGIPSQGKGNI